VRPRTVKPWRKMTPAPRKPIPVTICAAIRLGSKLTTLPLVRNSRKPYAETSVKSPEPTATSMCVRSPAAFSSSSRSSPITPPSSAATARRRSAPSQPTDGRSAKGSLDGGTLLLADLLERRPGGPEQLVELRTRERVALRRRLHLNEPAVAGHDHVQVDVGRRVLGVVQVEQELATHDPDRDGRDRVSERLAEPETVERAPGGHVRAR